MVGIHPRAFSFFDPRDEANSLPRVLDFMVRDLLPPSWLSDPSWPSTRGAPANLHGSENGVQVELLVPGYRAEDIEVAIEEEDRLVVRGERHEAAADAGEGQEPRLVGCFERSFRLPFRPDAERVQAAVTNGVLEVRVPRAESDMPRRIPVIQS